MEKIRNKELTERYQAAVDSFINKVQKDPNIIAVILCGSLSYDQVWEKSDIDINIIVRDMKINYESFSLIEDDITINATVVPRSGFKRFLESQRGGSMLHSYFSKGRIVYTTDESLYEYLEEFKQIGNDDLAQNMMYEACELYNYYEKSLKWLTVKDNLHYTQYYLLKAAEVIARMVVCQRGEIPTREALIKAQTMEPELISTYYDGAMSHHYDRNELTKAIDKIEQYLEQNLDIIKKPILDYMSDGEMKTVTMIAGYFQIESHFIIGFLDYLAEKGVIAKVSQTIRITPKSKPAVEEITYQYFNY